MNSRSKPFMFIIAYFMISSEGNSTPLLNEKRFMKRNLNNFGLMVECETNRNKWTFNGYGCWCGLGGVGQPLDNVDRCCYEHDKCYDVVMAGSECTTSADPYIVSYKVHNCSDCAPANTYSLLDWIGWVTIGCRRAICTCDSDAAKCFAKNVYDKSLANYDKSKCNNHTSDAK